ncbi:unnamed protein product [Closterium sp. NIES-54]
MDTNKVLQLIIHPELAPLLVEGNVRSFRDVEMLQKEYLADTGRGFESTTFYVEGFPPQVMLHRDPLRALADMFRHKHNAPGFRMGPRRDKDSESGHRAYSTAETGTWWQEAQEFIGMDKIVAALILYSDVTHLSNNGRKKAHPVVMTLGNIAFPKRWGRPGHSLLALLPIPPSNMPSHLKVELYNACIAKLLEPLLRLKDNGVMLLDSEGIERWVVPLLYAWACDYPESGKLTCTKSGQGCMKPCSLCYVDRESLSSVELLNNVRTPAQQQWVRDEAAGVAAGADDNPLKLYSTFDIDCALWKWQVGSLPWGNPFLAVMADIMHQADLGMLDHIVVCIRAQHPTMMKILDLRLLRLTLKTRINSLREGSDVRGGAEMVSAVRGGAEMVSAVRGGAEMVSAVRGGTEMVSAVRGGAEMVSAVRGGAEMVSAVRGGAEMVSAVRGGAEMASAVWGGAEMVSAVRGGAEMVSAVRGGAEMVSAVRGGAEMVSAVRGGGGVS